MAKLVEISRRDSTASRSLMHAGKGVNTIQAFYLSNLGINLATLKQTAGKIRNGDTTFKEVTAAPYLTGTAYALALGGVQFGEIAKNLKVGSHECHFAVASDPVSGISLHLHIPDSALSKGGIFATDLDGSERFSYRGDKTWVVTFQAGHKFSVISGYSPNGVFAIADEKFGIGRGPTKNEGDKSAVFNELKGSPGAGLAMVALPSLKHRNDDRMVDFTSRLGGKSGIFTQDENVIGPAKLQLEKIDADLFHPSTDEHAVEIYMGVQHLLERMGRA